MNAERPSQSGTEPYRSLQILDELSNNDSLTQRDLSSNLGIALGLVNSYIKNLVKKGFITVKAIPPKRYAYYLTPKGFTEKTRLTYHMLGDYTRVYREARKNFQSLFFSLQQEGNKTVVFVGADEVAEIAYITLQETGLTLTGVVDIVAANKKFFGNAIESIGSILRMDYDCIVITSYLKHDTIYEELIRAGIKKETIRTMTTI